MPVEPLALNIRMNSELDPDKNPVIQFDTPLAVTDTSKVHLYSKHDTLWYRAPFILREHAKLPRAFELLGEWRPDIEYSLEFDSAAFADIYGKVTQSTKKGFKVKSTDDYCTLFITISGMSGKNVVAQLVNSNDAILKEVTTTNGNAEFFYVSPGTYYLRMFHDENGNGVWDTGNYDEGRQAEEVYYYPGKFECKEKWDYTETWDPTRRSGAHQKPSELVKQKADKEKTIKHRNLERAQKLGIEYLKEAVGKTY